jgi:hypothetical protein
MSIFVADDTIPGMSDRVMPMCLALGYEKDDVDKMYRLKLSF